MLLNELIYYFTFCQPYEIAGSFSDDSLIYKNDIDVYQESYVSVKRFVNDLKISLERVINNKHIIFSDLKAGLKSQKCVLDSKDVFSKKISKKDIVGKYDRISECYIHWSLRDIFENPKGIIKTIEIYKGYPVKIDFFYFSKKEKTWIEVTFIYFFKPLSKKQKKYMFRNDIVYNLYQGNYYKVIKLLNSYFKLTGNKKLRKKFTSFLNSKAGLINHILHVDEVQRNVKNLGYPIFQKLLTEKERDKLYNEKQKISKKFLSPLNIDIRNK